MSEKRFFKKEYPYDWWFVFDKEQKICASGKDAFSLRTEFGDLVPMTEEQVIDLLNELIDKNGMILNGEKKL